MDKNGNFAKLPEQVIDDIYNQKMTPAEYCLQAKKLPTGSASGGKSCRP